MVTFHNYYGIEPGEPSYDYCLQHGIVLSLKRAFGVEDLANADLVAATEGYLRDSGMSDSEIEALKVRLSGDHA